MIPFIEWKTIELGPLTLQVWGMFVAMGFLVGAWAAAWFAKRRGLESKVIYDLTVWMIAAGMIGGRLGHVLFYDFSKYLEQPLEIFALWHGGMSMMGGLLGSLVVGIWYLKKRKVDVWEYADTAFFGLPFGIAIGRIGCFLIHDHPGTATDFFLGVPYPDGVVRHDHGLYEILNGIAIAAVFTILAMKKVRPPIFLAIFSIWYGAFRLVMDEFRIVDTTYFSFTPAQYFGFIMVLGGVGLLMWIRRGGKRP